MSDTTTQAPATTPPVGTTNPTGGSTPAPTGGADWLAIQVQAPTASSADIYSMGINPSSVTMQPADFYKQSPKIQAMFKTPTGSFDDDGFNKFYLKAQQDLNSFHKQDFDLGNVTTDLWDNTSVARYLKAPINKNPVKVSLTSDDPFTNLKSAEQSFLGLTEINKWTTPKKSLREVAEGQVVRDGITGKPLDYTPEDTGLHNLFGFTREPLVMAQYDDDVKDAKGNIIHKRGEVKYDDKGLPYYETLAGRDIAGRQQLSAWNTLTKEGSFANKFDFMDDDGINKSITGTIVKSVATLLPLFIGGPISTAYQAYYISSNLLDATAQIGKSIDAILNDDAKSGNFYKWANQLQGYTGQGKTTLSDHDQQSMFSIGNLANQAVDAVLMMKSQSSVFSWPTKIKQYQMAKELNLVEGGLADAMSLTPEKEQELQSKLFDINSYLQKAGGSEELAVKALSKNAKALETYGKYSDYMATGYMAATMATSMSGVAKAAGLNDKDTGMLYLGYMSALAPFFRLGLAKWVEDKLPMDQLAQDINAKTMDYASKYLPQDIVELNEKVGGSTFKSSGIALMAAGRKMGQKIASLYSNISMAKKFMNPGVAALAGGLEMGSIEALKTGVQGIYNSLSAAGLTSTKGDPTFDLKGDEVLKEIGSAAFGGAFGGAIFKMIGHNDLDTFKSDNLMGYVLNGFGNRVLDTVENLRKKGQLGSTSLSSDPLMDIDGNKIADMWSPVNKEHPISQNDFIADRMTKTVKIMDAIRKANEVLDPNMTAEKKNQFYADIIDSSTDTDLRDRIHNTANEIYNISIDLANAPATNVVEATNDIEKKKTRLAELHNTLEYLQGDDSMEEFFRQGLFNVRRDINKPFGVKTLDDFAKQVNPAARSFENLSGDDKNKATTLYDTYKSAEGPGSLRGDLISARTDFDKFNANMDSKGGFNRLELFKESMRSLEEYANIIETVYKDAEGNPISKLHQVGLQDDFLAQLKGIKYIPDFMYDQIEKKLTSFQSEGADEFLSKFSPNIDSLKEGILDNLNTMDISLSEPFIKDYVKKMLGDKEFEEFINSESVKDLRTNNKAASDYSLLDTLKKVSNSREDSKLLELRATRQAVSSLTDEQAYRIMTDYERSRESGQTPELFDYLDRIKFGDYIKAMEDSGNGADDLLMSDEDSANVLLRNMLLIKHIEDTVSTKLSAADHIAMIQSAAIDNNFLLNLIVDGKFHSNGNVLHTNTIRQFDTTALDNNVRLAREFNKDRVTSPLAEILEPQYRFLKDEMGALRQVGESNYLNSSDEFSDALDSHIAAINRVSAIVEAAVSVNPLVNDFRKHNPGSLDTDLRNLELFVMSGEDASHLKSELGRNINQLNYLKEVNEFNKNNILAKLLRESGLDVASKFQTLKQIATNEEVVNLLPSLSNLFTLSNVTSYADSFKTASDDLRNAALYEMSKFEHAIYEDFQKLSDADKSVVANATFKPINVDSLKFYDKADGASAYNDFAQTVYLAKIYGSSTMDFYKKYAGHFDTEKQLFENLDRLKHAPFTNQENAIRLAYLAMKGDRSVVNRLFNAYASTENDTGIYNFDTNNIDTLTSRSSATIWGGPGTGKTTAVLSGIMNLLDQGQNDVLLLAPKDRQVKTLIDTLSDGGFESRIDKGNSKVFREFMKSLPIRTRDGRAYDFSENDAKVEFYSNNGTPQSQFSDLFQKDDKSILASLDLFKDKSDTSFTLTDSLVNFLGRYRLIAIDEYTQLNPVDLGILHKIVDYYNGSTTVQIDPSKRILIIESGDVNQMGYIGKDGTRRSYTDVAKAIVSQPLTTTLRSGLDLINNTLVDLLKRAIKYNNMTVDELGKTDTLLESKQNPIKANYYEGPDGNKGIKIINKQGDATVDNLSFITALKGEFTGKDLVYVAKTTADITKAQALLRQALGDNWNMFADIYTPEEIQGGEYKYAIIDAKPNLAEDGPTKPLNIKRVHEFLNTMLSRATMATLYLNDGAVNDYVTFDSQSRPKAIEQIKLNKDLIATIKSDKQNLLKQILQDYTEGITLEGDKPSVEGKERMSLPVGKISDFDTLFQTPSTEPRLHKEKGSDLTSYNYFSTIADYDKVFSLLPGLSASDRAKGETDKKISSVINSYKYYLLHKDELGDRQITLKNNFQKLFEDNNLDWENPSFYIEVGKRGESGMNAGRTELTSNFDANPNDIIVSLKLKLLSKESNIEDAHAKALDLTIGFLNNIDDLSKRDLLVLNPNDRLDTNFFKKVKDYVNGNSEADIPIGTTHSSDRQGNLWQSPLLTHDEFREVADIYGSRIIYDNASKIEHTPFREEYFDFAMSDPQVVVANLVLDNNKSILDPTDTNPEYKQYWSDLKGKSVMFISDVYELNTLSAKEMLDAYIKQLGYFNSDSFRALDERGKQEYIDELDDSITLPSNLDVKYRPGLIKMIKLDNPTTDFLDFRERFLGAVAMKKYGNKMTPDLLEKFNMPLYVKDRLVKSLLTLREFLKDKKNKDWFQENVIAEQNKRAANWLDNVYEDIAKKFGDGQPVDRSMFTISELSLEKSGPITLREFSDKLDDLLDPTGEDSIFRGKYKTMLNDDGENTNQKVYKTDVDTQISADDLKLKLTGDKRKDFATGSLIDLRLFNLFKKTRNSNFADLIDLSLKGLASFENNADFRKYDLSGVFKDGKIESILIAQDDRSVDRQSNVLATAIRTSGDFSFNLGKLTHPFYSIDFRGLIDKFKSTPELDIVEEGKPIQEGEVAKPGETLPIEVQQPKESPTLQPKVIELNDTVQNSEAPFDMSVRERIVAESSLLANDPSLIGMSVDIDPINATQEQASYRVTLPDGSIYEMEYNMKDDTIKTTPISLAEGVDKVKVLKDIDKAAMENYDKMIDDMFGEKIQDPVLKGALDYYRNAFRHTMVGSNIVSMNAPDLKLANYDAELAKYNSDAATSDYIQNITDNATAFRPFNKQLRNISEYIKDYTPKVC